MAPHYASGALNYTPSANSTQLSHQGHYTAPRQNRDRAREIKRKRDRQERRLEAVIPRSPSPTVSLNHPTHLVDRMTYGHGGEVQSPTIDDSSNDMDSDEGIDFYDTLAPNPPLTPSASTPCTTQHGSSHHIPFNLHLIPPRTVQPATRPEPIRLFNSWMPHELTIDSPKASYATEPRPTPTEKAPSKPKRPANPYKGGDMVKRLVQNKKLQILLSGKPMPKPRKAADRMVLKCAGRQEFR